MSNEYEGAFLINSIMQKLYQNGWLFIGPIKSTTLNDLYFRYDESLIRKSNPSVFFTLSFYGDHEIALISSPNEMCNLIKTEILRSWPQGLREENKKVNAHVFRVKANLWDFMEEESTRRLMCKIFKSLGQYSFKLYGTCTLSKSAFIFQYDHDTYMKTFSVSLYDYNKLKVFDATQNHKYAIREAVKNGWIGDYEVSSDSSVFVFRSDSVNTIHSTVLIMHLLHNLQIGGVKLLCSTNINEYCKTLFFVN